MLLGPVSPEDLTPEHRPYRPLGAALQLLRCRDPEVLISGPANTGKSR
jgi:phage terminase large subunit